MANSQFKWQDFSKLKNADDLDTYINGREYSHDKYCHYTSLKALDDILDAKCLWVSQVNVFNDKKDAGQFGDDRKNYFSICFSTGVNENLSLWYMYSGMHGKGARLEFTKAKIKKLFEQSDFYLYRFNEKTHKLVGCGKKLVVGKTLEKEFRDVVYYRITDKKCDMKYNTMTNHTFAAQEWEKYDLMHKGFSKDLIWYYEKETRLLFHIIGDAQKYIDPNYDYKIVIENDKLWSYLKVMLAPEIDSLDCEELSKYENIQAFKQETNNVVLSEYHGMIHMGLCDRCEYKNRKRSKRK